MESPKSLQSGPSEVKVPAKWEKRYIIKRIDERDIEISLAERNGILECLNRGERFIRIGEYILMLNAIKSIDPKYGSRNIPPRPHEKKDAVQTQTGFEIIVTNAEEIDEWDKLFADPINNLLTE